MSEPNPNRDADLVRAIAQSYRPARAAPSARAAFRAGVDARIRRRASRRIFTAGAAVATAAAALFMVPTHGADEGNETVEDALLTVALPAGSEDLALPADYQAIDDLFLEGV